jgi:hypothetical protein
MTKFRLAAVAVLVSCGLLIAGAGTASAQDTPLTKVVPISGTAENGKEFVGKYRINKFVAEGDQVFAVGKLTGKLKNRKVTRRGVRIPVESFTKAPAGTATSSQLVCQVLNLTLGPLDLNLLGLRIQLNQVNLRITAIPGGGLLGDLLCGLTNLLNPTGLLGNTLAQILNSLLALVPQTASTAALPR